VILLVTPLTSTITFHNPSKNVAFFLAVRHGATPIPGMTPRRVSDHSITVNRNVWQLISEVVPVAPSLTARVFQWPD
jgi:hypothetical protein